MAGPWLFKLNLFIYTIKILLYTVKTLIISIYFRSLFLLFSTVTVARGKEIHRGKGRNKTEV